MMELAACCFCSERHARTLLRQLSDAGWLQWRAQAGRAKRGELRFLLSPEEARATVVGKELDKGLHQNALELAQLAPDQLRQLLYPHLGGQWQNDVPTLRIPYYRPLEPITPGFLEGRAEKHFTGQVYAGLTRFTQDCPLPKPDLAHHWHVSDDGLSWDFFLHPTLYWHNGERVKTSQLHQQLTALLALPAIGRLFNSIAAIEMPHGGCLRFVLHRPDYWLAHRLASYCSRLAHPNHPQIGSGPFRITRFKDNLVRLESFEYYHLRHPLLAAVEYWITPQLFDTLSDTSCLHPVQIAIGQPEQLTYLRPVTRQISLGFCYLAIKQEGRLNKRQARALMQMVHRPDIIATLPVNNTLLTATTEILPGWEIARWPTEEGLTLPEKLTLIYHLPVELHAIARQLKYHLAEYGCDLTLIFHNAKTWSDCPLLEQADIVMGDRLIGESAGYTLEQWLRCDPLWPGLLSPSSYRHLCEQLDQVQLVADGEARLRAMKHLYYGLTDEAIMTPLFNYRYQISAPPGVEGIAINEWGWFDFSQAWLPPPGMS